MALISRKLLKARPQELGKIKIGGKGKEITSKKGNKFQPPIKYDHFVITTRVRGKDGNFVRDERIHSHKDVGPKPTELAGILMFEAPEENFHSEMVQYQGRGKDGKTVTCNGETATNLKTGGTGPCQNGTPKGCKCKPYSRLHLQLWASPYTMGYHLFRSTSWESANNIQTALEEIYARFGTCYNAPVKLVVYPSEDAHDDGNSTSYKVGLVLAMSMSDTALRMGEARGYLETARGTVRALSAGVQEDQAAADEEDAEDIGSEFFPPEDAEVRATLLSDAMAADDDDFDEADYEVVEDEDATAGVADAGVADGEPEV